MKNKVSEPINIFLNIVGLLLSARETFLNNFKSKVFPIKSLDKTPTPEPTALHIKLREKFFMKKIENDKKNINNQILRKIN